MPLSRLLTLIAGFCLILGMMIWLITSLSWLYSQISWSAPPLLANLLLLLLIILLGLLIFAFFYYFQLLTSPKNRKGKARNFPKIPLVKSEAAAKTLKAVQQQVAQIQDEIARQNLLSRSQEIEANLLRGNIQIVIFGTGSAGKTSLINALMGQVVGQVNASMGTTEVGETYRLHLQGLEREILMIDTPGILEAGESGFQRQELASQLATEADLLVFVVANDLQKSEYEPLRTLALIGKRSLLVFNKIDLYPDSEREIILSRLRQRVQEFIPPMDVVAITANPQPIQLENGTLHPFHPDLMPLIRRMAAILRAEGEDLIADNILLQSQRLGEQTRQLIDHQRRRQSEKIVEKFQWIGAGVIAVTPLPVIDVLATAAVNAQMVVEIGKIYGCELNLERGRELALSLAKTLASLGIVEGAIKFVTTALQLSGVTFLVGKAIQGVTAAYLIRIAGKSFIEYFRQDQDWGDGGITEVVQRQFQLTRRDDFVKSFIKDAITKVVEPLKVNLSESEDELEELRVEIPIPESEIQEQLDLTNDWETPQRNREDW